MCAAGRDLVVQNLTGSTLVPVPKPTVSRTSIPSLPSPIGRKPLELDRNAILRDRQHGQSLGQLAKSYRVSRATIHRVLREHASTTLEQSA